VKGDVRDKKGLIYEAYRIDGIQLSECRTIFLDWALSVPLGRDMKADIQYLLTQYADKPRDHPMTQTLLAALHETKPARRRGGRAGRMKP